jgi:uncharacterized RDD family membrane protein YckC
MTVIRQVVVTLIAIVSIALLSGVARAQTPARAETPGLAAQPPIPAPVERVDQDPFDRDSDLVRWSMHPVIRVGQDYVLRTADRVRDVFVLSGSATIEGRVDGDVVVLLGPVRLTSTAFIRGSLVVVGGNATIEDGAAIRNDLLVVGGALETAIGFSPGGEHIIVGSAPFGDRLRAVVPWFTRGLLWGRPIVPGLGWVWGIVGVFFIVYLALNLVLHEPVGACADKLAEKPVSSFMTGLLVLLLTGPVSLLMAVSIVGLAVVPFLICALVIAGVIGRVSVDRWIGRTVLTRVMPETRLEGLATFVIGFLAVCLLYMVPVLGFVAWAMIGVFGLGAAFLAFVGALKRERPVPVAVPVPVPVPVAPAGDASSPGAAAWASPVVPPVAFAPLRDDEAGAAFSSEAPSAAASPRVIPAVSAEAAAIADLTLFPRATFLDRLAAFVLDVVLVVLVNELTDFIRDDSAPILLFLYLIGFWAWKGTTLGGIVCNLRVVRTDGSRLSFPDALVRGLAGIFSLGVFAIGCLCIIRDPESQAWHDKIAGTYVVKVPRNWPLV